MHQSKAHCSNHNRLRSRSTGDTPWVYRPPAEGPARYSQTFWTVIYFIITAFTVALIFWPEQKFVRPIAPYYHTVNIGTELRLAVIRNAGGKIIQFYGNTLANIHIIGIPLFSSVEDTRLLFQPASCSSIFAKSDALFTLTQPELSADIFLEQAVVRGYRANR